MYVKLRKNCGKATQYRKHLRKIAAFSPVWANTSQMQLPYFSSNIKLGGDYNLPPRLSL